MSSTFDLFPNHSNCNGILRSRIFNEGVFLEIMLSSESDHFGRFMTQSEVLKLRDFLNLFIESSNELEFDKN